MHDSSDDFRSDVARYIRRHNLLPEQGGAPVVVALSGGADSVALLDVLCALGYGCVAAHCNYHLRGAESDRDEAHARAVADRLGVPVEVRHFDVAAYRREHAGVSVEMACRDLRYGWFAELMAAHCAAAVAVAHHRDDQVETFMLNALRGSGVRGLAGMRPRRDNIIRPLLDMPRQRIEEYLRCRGIGFVVDSTNLASEFKRNKLRNIVLPALAGEFPGASRSIAATAGYAAEASDFIDLMVSCIRRDLISQRGLDVRRLVAEYPQMAAYVLFEMLKGEGIDRSVADSIVRAAGGSGQQFAGGLMLDHGYLARCDSGEMADALTSETLDGFPQLVVERLDISAFDPKADASALYLSESALEGEPRWTLRPWRQGDRIAPYGMRGTKLVSDIFTDFHIPVARKRRTLVLLRDDSVLWIAGMRASRHFPVSAGDSTFIKVKLEPDRQ